jgi:hypothetical protein
LAIEEQSSINPQSTFRNHQSIRNPKSAILNSGERQVVVLLRVAACFVPSWR